MKRAKWIATLGFVASTVTATTAMAAGKDIVETAQSAGSFKTLVVAIQTAGLVETLKGKGPFTIFAPNDAAFAKSPKEQLDAQLADKAKLTQVLTYHVVAGKVMAADVKATAIAHINVMRWELDSFRSLEPEERNAIGWVAVGEFAAATQAASWVARVSAQGRQSELADGREVA